MKLCKASYKQNQNQTKKYEASEFHNMFFRTLQETLNPIDRIALRFMFSIVPSVFFFLWFGNK